MIAKFREVKNWGPFKRFEATLDQATPRPQLTAEQMMTPKKGKRGYVPKGTDRRPIT